MIETPAPSFWQRLQQIPRGYIYGLLALVVVWQLMWPRPLPIIPSAPTEGVYNAIRKVPKDKLIILSTDWDASTQAETGPQTTAIMQAIFQSGRRFALLNLGSPAGVKLANDLAQAVATEHHKSYGRDWCNWGYKYGGTNIIMGLGKNIPTTIGADWQGKPMKDLPMMAGVRDHHDVGLVIEISGAAMTELWLQFFQGPYGVPLANAITAVMAPGYYPYLDSHQLQGMLVGAKGAAEMESLAGHPTQATRIMYVQSWAHLLILLLIVVGNLGYLLARKGERR